MNISIPFLRKSILIVLALTSFLAVYVAGGLFFPYITGKSFAFRTLVEIAAVLYSILAIVEPKYRPYKSTSLIVYGVFVAILFVADIFGVNPMNSLFSNYERMEGFVTHIHLFVFTAILVFLRVTSSEWNKWFQVYLVGNALVLVQAFGEIITISNKLSAGEQVGTRISGTLGNPAYLSIYTIFGIAFATLLLIRRKTAGKFEQVAYAVMIVLNLIVFWRAETRGTILGVLGGIFAGLCFYVFRNRKNKNVQKIAGMFFAGLIALVLVFSATKNSTFVQSTPTLKRLADISLTEQTVRSRFMIWGMSLEGAKERPLLGYGQENFVYVFAKHYNPEMFDQEQWFDRSHNVFMDWLIAAGIIGLLAYLGLFGSALRDIYKNTSNALSEHEQVLLVGLLTTYFIHNVFVFDNLISYIGFFTVFAFVVGSLHDHTQTPKHKDVSTKMLGMSGVTVAAVAVTVGVFVWFVCVGKPYTLNKNIISMYQVKNLDAVTINNVIDGANMSTVVGTHEAREQILNFSAAVIASKASDDIKMETFKKVHTIFNTEILEDPENPRPLVTYASYLSSVGQNKEAAAYLERALTVTPQKTLLWVDLAKAYISIGDYENATRAAKQSFDLAPRSVMSANVLASLYYVAGEKTSAESVWTKAVTANNSSQDVLMKQMGFYKEMKDQEMLIKSAEQLKTAFPEQSDAVDQYVAEANKQ